MYSKRRRIATVVGPLAVAAVGIGSYILFNQNAPRRIDFSAYEPPAPERKAPAIPASQFSDSRRSNGNASAEGDLLSRMKAGGAERDAAIQELKTVAARRPYRMVADLPQWLAPLMEAELYEDVLALTDAAFASHAANTAAVSDFAAARLQCVVALHRTADIAVEARRAFNVATQRRSPASCRLWRRLADSPKRFLTPRPSHL